MSKALLQNKMKSKGTAYLCFLFLGSHYLYMGKYLLQILFWITFGGLFIWAIIDLLTLSSRIDGYNARLAMQIEQLERGEREHMIKSMAAIQGKDIDAAFE